MIATLFVTFILLLACSFPIAVSQSFASMFLIFGDAPLSLESFTKAIMSGFSSFTLVAIPLFTFAGDIMGKGGISKRLINVAKLSLGNRTGGLGIVSIVACMIFAAISGTGSATVAAIGLIMIPEMLEAGYDRAYSASLVATAGTIGTIIPPSICMVVYAIAAGCSVTAMFTAGFPVGILVGAVLCIYCALSCRKRGYKPVYVKYTAKDWVKTIVEAIPSFLVPVIILGGIYGGIFTPHRGRCCRLCAGRYHQRIRLQGSEAVRYPLHGVPLGYHQRTGYVHHRRIHRFRPRSGNHPDAQHDRRRHPRHHLELRPAAHPD